jgi:hypothetical protein
MAKKTATTKANEAKITHSFRIKNWEPDLTDLTSDEIKKVEEIKGFFEEFDEAIKKGIECPVYIESNIQFDFITGNFNKDISLKDFTKYLKGIYSNKDRFISRWVKGEKEVYFELFNYFGYPFLNNLLQNILDTWDNVTPFTYSEAFSIKNDSFKALVFGTISIPEMINELGGVRICTDGIETRQKLYTPLGDFIEETTIHNIYEMFECSGEKLGITGNLYAVKCWCTTTNKEHYVWLPDDRFKKDPLNAIASTFMVFEDLMPFFKEIKRQGDVLMVEYTDSPDYDKALLGINKDSKKISLTKELYFNSLTSQA